MAQRWLFLKTLLLRKDISVPRVVAALIAAATIVVVATPYFLHDGSEAQSPPKAFGLALNEWGDWIAGVLSSVSVIIIALALIEQRHQVNLQRQESDRIRQEAERASRRAMLTATRELWIGLSPAILDKIAEIDARRLLVDMDRLSSSLDKLITEAGKAAEEMQFARLSYKMGTETDIGKLNKIISEGWSTLVRLREALLHQILQPPVRNLRPESFSALPDVGQSLVKQLSCSPLLESVIHRFFEDTKKAGDTLSVTGSPIGLRYMANGHSMGEVSEKLGLAKALSSSYPVLRKDNVVAERARQLIQELHKVAELGQMLWEALDLCGDIEKKIVLMTIRTDEAFVYVQWVRTLLEADDLKRALEHSEP